MDIKTIILESIKGEVKTNLKWEMTFSDGRFKSTAVGNIDIPNIDIDGTINMDNVEDYIISYFGVGWESFVAHHQNHINKLKGSNG